MADVKVKMEVVEEPESTTVSYEERVAKASVISKPMASKKLAKKITKLIRKSSKQKFFLRSGLKLVQSKIRKGETGLAVMAGNASPIEVICHLPAVCEDRKIPYVYVPTGRDLGNAMGVKRCTLVLLIRPHADYQDLYDEVAEEMKALPIPVAVEL